MLSFKGCMLGAVAFAATLGAAVSAQATVITLTPVYPGTITGVTTYSKNETLEFKFTVDAPYNFDFSATGTGGNFPFPISISAMGTSGTFTETFGPFPVHGSVDYTLTTTGVPEPASWALMIVGFAGVGGYMRRRQVKAAAV